MPSDDRSDRGGAGSLAETDGDWTVTVDLSDGGPAVGDAVSFTRRLFEALGLDVSADGYYLEDYGHVQSADQVIALDEGLAAGRLDAGDLVCFLGAGTGYTWAASVLTWHGPD